MDKLSMTSPLKIKVLPAAKRSFATLLRTEFRILGNRICPEDASNIKFDPTFSIPPI